MLYRSVLAVLFVLAILLTLNERRQEERARQSSDGAPPASRVFQEGQRPPLPTPPSSAAQAQMARPPYPPPPPPVPAPTVTNYPGYPSPSSAAQAQTARSPFVPHQVRLRQDTELLRAPEPTAPKVEPLAYVAAGVSAAAVDERDGWYLLDANVVKGWAPVEAVEEP